jgi:sulfotransferase family protein
MIHVPPGGPNVVGATGGSGTRVVARVMRAGGMFIGRDLNRSDDAVAFGAFSDAWINRYLTGEAQLEEMNAELERLVSRHLEDRRGETSWGWKEPRSIYLLPFLHAELPSLRFLHVVRDGRDMAFSANQQQPRKHGAALLGEEVAGSPEAAIAVWAEVNTAAADYGGRELGPAYARLRFEDLCADPPAGVERILAFFGLEADAAKLARKEVKPPDSLGRWRREDPDEIERLERTAGAALERFGYR